MINADYQVVIKKMARMEEENEILKKAMGIYAKKKAQYISSLLIIKIFMT
ncbi:hypothetical protein [Brassicibacter mesophilus]|jgi:hypothetical protein